MKWLLGLLIIFAMIGVVFSVYIANYFLKIALLKDNPWYHKKGHRLLNPDNFQERETRYTKIEEQQKQEGEAFWTESFAEDRWLKIKDETLYARCFIPYPDNHRWAICVHGYRSNGKRDMAYTALRFAEEGYNVLVPDLRAHGKSSGNKIGMGWLDRLDLLSWISDVLAIDMEAEIILVGGSMGAATVMMASGEKLPTNVRGLIVDCGYTSVYDEFKYVLHESFHLPAFPILTIANQLALNNYGFQLKTASSVRQLHKNTLPTFFIHGTGDRFVPMTMFEENLAATQGIQKGLIVAKAPHLSSSVYEPENYYSSIFEFLEENCPAVKTTSD